MGGTVEAEAERLVNTYSDLILRLSYTYLKSTQDAEDICQNILIKLLNGGCSHTGAEHEKAWVIRATINACKDELRAFRRKTVGLETLKEAPAPEVPDSTVLDAVQSLPQKYRETIYLYYYEGYSIKETAALLGRSESAVSSQLDRGRSKLKRILGGDYCEQRA